MSRRVPGAKDGGSSATRTWRDRLVAQWSDPQHRDTLFLTINTLLGAATGLLFWLILARIVHLPPSEVGLGFAIISLGTTVGVLGKGGLDTALVRNVPRASRQEGMRLLRFAVAIGGVAVLVFTGLLAIGARVWSAIPDLTPVGWSLVAAIGLLLVTTWLQDAHFLAENRVRWTLQRNVVFAGARLALPIPIVALSVAKPVPLAWSVALLLSALTALALATRTPRRPGGAVPRTEFLQSGMRNISGSTAEFLPGLLLAPMVLAFDGPDAAGYFGMAWTGAALLFLVSAAISRSALASLVRNDAEGLAPAIRRGVRHFLLLITPAALVAILFAPQLLSILGPDYAREGRWVFVILASSAFFVAPAYLWLGILRAQERPRALIVFPTAMVVTLLVMAPVLGAQYGMEGIALAWLLSNVPFGLYGGVRLYREARVRAGDDQAADRTCAPEAE